MKRISLLIFPVWLCGCEFFGPPGWERNDVGISFYEVLAPRGGANPMPLVVALHGDEGSSAAVKDYWTPTWMKQQDFILVLPQNPLELDGRDQGWSAQPDASARFLWDVLDDVTARYNVDPSRMYLTGVSAGAVFIGQRGFTFQHVFAAIQLSCGSSLEPERYELPDDASCKAAARFAVSGDDFLYDESLSMRDALVGLGHEVEFVTTACSGHCCGGAGAYARDAYAWFIKHSLCSGDRDPGNLGVQIDDSL